jgi:serine/threonine-protein kinase
MNTQRTDPAADIVLGRRYRLMSRIAGGGMGDVWCASDESLGRVVAVKILRREYADDPTFLARFLAEARHTAALSHPGIAAVYDYSDGSQDEVGQPFLVMEHVPGEPLTDVLHREGSLSNERTLEIVGQAATALQCAHDGGVIHRDVKPANLMITAHGDVKVTDFGISRASNSVPLTQTGAIMGTAFYISPEQASGRSVTPASDLYSLGVVAYECLSGRRPFGGDTPVSVALAQVREEPPDLPGGIDPRVRRLVMGMLAKDPRDRPESAGALAREAFALRDTVDPPAARTMALPVVEVEEPSQRVEPPRGPDPQRGFGPRTDPGFRLPATGATRRWPRAAIALGALAVLLALAAYGCSRSPGAAGGAPATRSDPAARQAVENAGLRAPGGSLGTVTVMNRTKGHR